MDEGADEVSRHYHLCERCAEPWEHEEKSLSGKEWEDYHKCPTCGSGPYVWQHDKARATMLAAKLVAPSSAFDAIRKLMGGA